MKRSIICLFILWIGISCYPTPLLAQTNEPVIDFTADTQAPLFIERIIRKTNNNEKATEMIFNEINKRCPVSLFILGDVVSLGFENSKWKSMDGYLKLLRNNGIPVYAALGNHELMINATKGGRLFQQRFPEHSPTGYVETIDSVAIILLNSNFEKMKQAAIDTQDAWYNNTLHRLDSDASVKFVIVGCHHSPYTNSKVVNPSVKVQQKFVAPFQKSKKCVLFLSGHSHNFERFEVNGKCFLVIGGGGGINQSVHTDKGNTHDLSANYKPMFHYIEVKRIRDSLQVTSRQLKADFSGFANGLTITL